MLVGLLDVYRPDADRRDHHGELPIVGHPTPLKLPAAAAHLANNILYILYAACQSPNGCPP